MTPTDAHGLEQKIRDARKACHCLFAQVPEEVARDVLDKVDAALTGYTSALAQARREGMEAGAKVVDGLIGKDSGNWNRAMSYAAAEIRKVQGSGT